MNYHFAHKIEPSKLETIRKLIALSSSPNDHEALLAVRTAHDIARKNGSCLEQLIVGRPPSNESFKSTNRYAASWAPWVINNSRQSEYPDRVGNLLIHVRQGGNSVSQKTEIFIRGVFDYYKRNQKLSPKQRAALDSASESWGLEPAIVFEALFWRMGSK